MKIVMEITTEIQVVMEAVIMNLEKGRNFLQHKVVNIKKAMFLFK